MIIRMGYININKCCTNNDDHDVDLCLRALAILNVGYSILQ